MQSSSLKLFNSTEQKPMLLKRQAFAMFSGENDQYHFYLPLIQGTTQSVSVKQICTYKYIAAKIYLCYICLF